MGSGLPLPNGIKSELAESLMNESNDGNSSRSRRDRSLMSDEGIPQRGSSSSGMNKEKNTLQSNKAMKPIDGAPTNISASQLQSSEPLGLPPGLSVRMPPGAAFGFVTL